MKYFNEANNNNKYLEEILNNENIINSILSNKKSINSLFNIENYKIKKINIDENFYLNDYYILDFNLFIKLGKINNDIYLIQNNEINLGFNSGKIFLILKIFRIIIMKIIIVDIIAFLSTFRTKLFRRN